MDSSQTLEMQILAKSEEAIKSLDKLIKKLSGIEKGVENIHKEISKVDNSDIKNATKEIDNVDKSAKKATKSMQALKNTFTFAGVKKLTQSIVGWLDTAVDQTEQLNLFNVVFGNIEKNGTKMYSKLGREAIRFQYQLNEAFGTNKTETLKYQALYQSMGENMGIGKEYSAIMSESMTKLTYDLASLYNKSESTTAEALRASVYAGQTKPGRSFGLDTTQQSLQPILDDLGIDRTVKQMSQAEKQILRYLAVMSQSKVAHGDFANTLESPANQLKIFKQQLVETKVAISSVFISAFANIMPYANALLMVVKEVSLAIATMFGIELTDYNTSIASQEEAYSDFEDTVNDATNSVKELKRQTLAFDQINNINDDSGSNGGSSSGGIDKRLLDAISGYDNGMANVQMKATKIRDSIMEWLGFTKELDYVTGEVKFKLKDGYSNLKLIGGIITTIMGFKLVNGIADIVKSLLGVNSLTKLSGENLTLLGKVVKSLKVEGWGATIAKIGSKISSILPVVTNVIAIGGSLIGVISGSNGIYKAMRTLADETVTVKERQKELAISFTTTTASGAGLGAMIGGSIGASFGPFGAAIGAVSGALISGISALVGYKDAIRDLAAQELFGNLTISVEQWSSILENSMTKLPNHSEKLAEYNQRMQGLTTSFTNASNELDLYGYKFGVIGAKISEQDGVLITNAIENMCNSTSQMISESTNLYLGIWGGTFNEMSVLTEEEEKNILKSIYDYGQNQQKELSNAQNNITKTYDTAIKARGYLTDEEYNYIQTQLQKIRELTEIEMTKSQTNIEYYKTLFNDKNSKLDEQSYTNFKTALDNFLSEKRKTIEDNYNIELNHAEAMRKTMNDNDETYYKLKEVAYQNWNQKQEELAKFERQTIESVYQDLANKYVALKDKTDVESRKQREIIENVFKDINIDASQIESKFSTVGKNCGVNFSDSLSNNLKVNGSTLYTSWNSVASKFNSKESNPFPFPTIRPLSPYSDKDGAIYQNGVRSTIPQYASGGIPTHGTMFVAGEAGAEIVGNINGRTEVLNRSQIASAIYSAVVSAMSNSGSQIDVHVHTDEGTVVDRINQRTKQTGICPITVV